MKQFFKRNLYKVALIVTLCAVATVAVTAGTFAALSAEYTWNSDSTEAGEFNYYDTAYDFTLFDQATIYPGNSGSGSIDVPDFGTNPVVWEFAETNEDTIPIVYYFLDNENKPIYAYSAYDFATVCADKYVKLSDEYVSCANISNDGTAMVTGLATNDTIYWAWPSVIYADNAGTEVTVATYDEYNTNLCAGEFLFADAIATALSDADFVYGAAKSISDDAYSIEQRQVAFAVKDGHIKFNTKIWPVYSNGSFRNVGENESYKADDCIVFFVGTGTATLMGNAATTAGLNFSIDKTTKYAISEDIATVSATGGYYLVKLFPDAASGSRPTVSVQITATVTQA